MTASAAQKSLVGRLRFRAANTLRRKARSSNGVWLALAIVAGGIRLLARWSKREREVVYRGELVPGEKLTLHHVEPDEASHNDTCGHATASE